MQTLFGCTVWKTAPLRTLLCTGPLWWSAICASSYRFSAVHLAALSTLDASWLSPSTLSCGSASSITLLGNTCTRGGARKAPAPAPSAQKGCESSQHPTTPHPAPCNCSHYHQCHVEQLTVLTVRNQRRVSQERGELITADPINDISIYSDSIHRASCPESIQLCQTICLCPLCLAATYYNVLFICHPTSSRCTPSLVQLTLKQKTI